MLRFFAVVLLLVTSAIGQIHLASNARISLESVQLLSKLCLTQGEVSMGGGLWSLSDVGPVTHQYITLASNSVSMKFIHEDWNRNGGHKVAIAQMIVSVLPNGSVADASCNRIMELDNGEVLDSRSSTCADQLVQETLDSMTKRFSAFVK